MKAMILAVAIANISYNGRYFEVGQEIECSAEEFAELSTYVMPKEEYEARHGQSTPASDMPDMYDVNALDNAQLRQQLSDSQNLAASYLQENDELKALLSDKDAQIATLTQELEQLKEQLDKLPKRTTTRKKEPNEDVEAEAVATEQAGA